MRASVLMLILLSVVACGQSRFPVVEQIEMRRSGRVSKDVILRSGLGSYHISEPFPGGTSGTFRMTAKQFIAFRGMLEPYRAKAEAYTDDDVRRMNNYSCPPNLPSVTDVGGMYIRWIGPHYNVHFLMAFGCDPDRHAARNRRMHAIFDRLPLPKQ